MPATQVVGPLDLTIGWLGTQTLFRIDVVNATLQQLRLQLQVFDPTIRIMIGGLPFPLPAPLASVTLYQKSLVQTVFTGVNGAASFRTIPAGNYTVRVDYLLVTYQFPLNVRTNDPTIVTVPFPHRTISLIGAISILSLRPWYWFEEGAADFTREASPISRSLLKGVYRIHVSL